jgi:hypothetical protein
MKLTAARALTGAIVFATPVFLLRPTYYLPTHTFFGRVLSFLQEDHWTRQRQSHPKQRQTLQASTSNQELSELG